MLGHPHTAPFIGAEARGRAGVSMGDKFRTRLDWKSRADGSHWAQCDIGGECAVIALAETEPGKICATAIVEVDFIGEISGVEDAKRACENWLLEIGAEPSRRSVFGYTASPDKKRS